MSVVFNENFSQTMRDCGRVWIHALAQGLAVHDLTVLQWAVLERVIEQSGRSQTELAHLVGSDAPSLVRVLDTLERQGWVERRPSEEDRRIKMVWLRNGVDARLEQVQADIRKVHEKAFSDLTETERAQWVDFTQRISRALA